MNKLIAVLALVGVTGCSSKLPNALQDPYMSPVGLIYPSTETREQSDRRLAHGQSVSDKMKSDYATRYAAFRCERHEVPGAKIFEIDVDEGEPTALPGVSN